MWSLLALIDKVLEIYSWVIIAAAIMSWLVAFGVVNTRNQVIRWVVDFDAASNTRLRGGPSL